MASNREIEFSPFALQYLSVMLIVLTIVAGSITSDKLEKKFYKEVEVGTSERGVSGLLKINLLKEEIAPPIVEREFSLADFKSELSPYRELLILNSGTALISIPWMLDGSHYKHLAKIEIFFKEKLPGDAFRLEVSGAVPKVRILRDVY